MVNAATNSSPVILLCLLCAAPAAAEAGHGRARATAVRTGAEALVGAPAEAAPLDRVGESPRRLSGYVMDDSTIRTAVAAWLSDSAAAELTYGHISTWETGGVTGIEYLFCAQSSTNWWLNQGCNAAAASFNDDISAWDTSGVTSLFRMFHTNPAFNQDLSGWSLDSVLYMEGVFIGASSFNQPIGGWQVQNVKKMDLMFYKASSFNQDLSGWSLDSVTSIGAMFHRASAFDQDLGWCVDDDVNLYGNMPGGEEERSGATFYDTLCESTSCGVGVKGVSCFDPSPAPSPAPMPAPTISPAPTTPAPTAAPSVAPSPAPTASPTTAAPSVSPAPTAMPTEWWEEKKNRRGIGLVLTIVVCVVASVVLLLAVSFCFLAGTFGSCSKHKKTKLPENPSSEKV